MYIPNFNSHAHVERDALKFYNDKTTLISTHTLTWSVTPCDIGYIATDNDFNSHAHVERDLDKRTKQTRY